MIEKVHRGDGATVWYKNGERHREDGPAVEWQDGTKFWYRDGKLHREDGPAVEGADGCKQWHIDGNPHREDGPAIEHATGDKKWFRSGYPYGISLVCDGVKIGCKVKTITEWDEWFAGEEEFKHRRDSKEFAVLLELWAQFKEQVGEIGELRI